MSVASNSITNIISQGLQNIQPGQYYPVNGTQPLNFGAIQTQPIVETPMSDDPEHWNEKEQLKMFIWFMKMHHEEDIKGFKAMRDIERSVEREEQLERERQRWELEQKYYANQAAQQLTQIQSANARLRKIVDELQVSDKPKKKPLWKRLLAM